ncbi:MULTISPECIES: hypothetical protein [unclassified Pseudoalteromonas]|uniref:hypothetical protein n=1 Tax=unclassified Pseudoalteromonas TaxID=194690 RepID=UPI0004184F2E|nr:MULTISPECIES: hypothetical protein [unclassified Pseudoalteromonas]MBH0028187.1 hypothetical protein [Pseudoalteromonas sp. SWN29]
MKLIPLMLILFIAGCSSFQPPWESAREMKTDLQIYKSYNLDTKYTVTTGSPMVLARTYKEYVWFKPVSLKTEIWNGQTLANDQQGAEYIFTPTYKLDGKNGDYILTAKNFYHRAIGIIAFDDGTVPENPVMRIDRKGSMKRYPITPKSNDKKIFEKHFFLEGDKSDQFMFELIYTGKSGQTINLLYREYINDMSRDSFRQSLTYNLNESKEISFKSLNISILEATNSEITFTVQDDNNLEWLR